MGRAFLNMCKDILKPGLLQRFGGFRQRLHRHDVVLIAMHQKNGHFALQFILKQLR